MLVPAMSRSIAISTLQSLSSMCGGMMAPYPSALRAPERRRLIGCRCALVPASTPPTSTTGAITSFLEFLLCTRRLLGCCLSINPGWSVKQAPILSMESWIQPQSSLGSCKISGRTIERRAPTPYLNDDFIALLESCTCCDSFVALCNGPPPFFCKYVCVSKPN